MALSLLKSTQRHKSSELIIGENGGSNLRILVKRMQRLRESERVTLPKANDASLPFDDEYFGAAVSNFVSHEVSDDKDKREVIRKTLHVVKKGEKFAFQDEFLIKQIYGNPDDLIANIRSWGISKVAFVKNLIQSLFHGR